MKTAAHWYALYVRTRYEKLAAQSLTQKGYEIFLPSYVSRRQWTDRVKTVELPLFPSYLFCRMDANHRLPVLSTPGVRSIVGAGSGPVPVDENEIQAVQAVVASGLPAQPWPFVKVGQTVYIEGGPLAGMEGVVVNFKGRCRLVVSVSLLQRSILVEMDENWVRPSTPVRRQDPEAVLSSWALRTSA